MAATQNSALPGDPALSWLWPGLQSPQQEEVVGTPRPTASDLLDLQWEVANVHFYGKSARATLGIRVPRLKFKRYYL